jgi:hypothetical protein
MARQLLGAVFRDEVEAGEAVRALHYWNRKRRQGLGIMSVVVCRAPGRAKYRPYRVVAARRGARWGMLFLALVAGLVAVGAAAANAAFLDWVAYWTRQGTATASGWVGLTYQYDPAALLRQASAFNGGRIVVAGAGAAVAGGIVGAILGGLLGAVAHLFKGFRRSIRREVVAELAPGMAAVLTWARESSIMAARSELERLGGSPPPNNAAPQPQVRTTPPPPPGRWMPPSR